MIMTVVAMIMSRMRVKTRGSRLVVPMRRVDMRVRMRRVIVAERDAFQVAWRTSDGVSLSKCNVVRSLTFKDEISGLLGRKRLMTAKPYNERSIHHLYRTVFCRSFYIFVDFAGSGGTDSPTGRPFVFTR